MARFPLRFMSHNKMVVFVISNILHSEGHLKDYFVVNYEGVRHVNSVV